MKRFIKLLLFSFICLSGNAQEHVLDYEGDLYFIPASMTKYGQPFLYSRSQNGFIVYDGDLKTQDYINEHSENSTEEVGENQSASDENEWWRDYGAEGCSMEWDNERNKTVYKLYKTEEYGGLFYSSLKIKSMDGTVKQTLNGINTNYAFSYRGKCYVRGNVSGKLYRIGTKKDNISQTRRGDVDDNGVVNVADHVKLSEIILNQNKY